MNKPEIGLTYTNEGLYDLFHCANMGGMRRSKYTNSLLIIYDHTKKDYSDFWEKGILHYTGMGKHGNQSLEFGQNKTVVNSMENGVTLLLFKVKNKTEYIFQGEIELIDEPYEAQQPDADNNVRNVWVFKFVLKNQPIFFDDSETMFNYSDEKIKMRANGFCEFCKNIAPFNDEKGQPYLQVFRSNFEISENQLNYSAALCPNCFAQISLLSNKNDINRLRNNILSKK